MAIKVSEVIAKLQQIMEEEGDLPVYDSHGFNMGLYDIAVEDGASYPKQWDMPKKLVMIGSQ
jgi:hypothetical protein